MRSVTILIDHVDWTTHCYYDGSGVSSKNGK